MTKLVSGVVCVLGLLVATAARADDYPQSEIDRPLTLPQGMFQGQLLLTELHAGDDDAQGLTLLAGFGITKELEADVGTGFNLHPSDPFWDKRLSLAVGYLVYDTEKLDLAPGIATSLDFRDNAKVFDNLDLSLEGRFLATDKIFILFGRDLIHISSFDASFMSLELNVAPGVQITPELSFALGLQLAHIKISGDFNTTTWIFADQIAIAPRLLYAITSKLDVQLLFTDDLKHAGDLWILAAGVNVRI